MRLNNAITFAKFADSDLSIWEKLIDSEVKHIKFGVGLIDEIESVKNDIYITVTFINIFIGDKQKIFHESSFLNGEFEEIEFDHSLIPGYKEYYNKLLAQKNKETLFFEKQQENTREYNKLKNYLEKFDIKSLWYITHINNVSSIIKKGIFCRDILQSKGIKVIDVSNEQVQFRRRQYHEYVNFYIADNTPMLYVVIRDYGDRIVMLEIDSLKVMQKDIIFTDGNAASNNTRFFSTFDCLSKLDWNIIKARRGAYSFDDKRIRAAEFLIKNNVEPGCIKGIHVQSSKSMDKVKGILNALGKNKIFIRKDLTMYGVN